MHMKPHYLRTKANSTRDLKVGKNYYSLYLHGLKDMESMDKLEVYKMELRGEQDDPSDLSADP